ncbi:MAG: HK97 gp10 family phage protein [Bacteroidales bacterium]|nr:HK97 gp10 family phage protein [Bacteroidales bacterium]
MSEFKIQTNTEEVVNALKNITPQLKQDLQNVVNDVSNDIANEARRLAPVGVTGFLRKSIRVKHEGDDTYVGSDLQYAPYVEYGTKPHWTSAQNLKDWAMYKLGAGKGKAGEKEALSVAYAIIHKIAQEGTKPHPYLTPAWDKYRDILIKRIDEIMR